MGIVLVGVGGAGSVAQGGSQGMWGVHGTPGCRKGSRCQCCDAHAYLSPGGVFGDILGPRRSQVLPQEQKELPALNGRLGV